MNPSVSDETQIPLSKDKISRCKACKKEFECSLMYHLTRKKGCQTIYGTEFEEMVARRAEDRKAYQKKYQKKYYTDNAESINEERRQYYDPEARNKRYDPEKYKKSYNPTKRRADYQKEKIDEQNGIFKESKAIYRDRKYCEIEARRENVKRMMGAMKYVRECCRRLEISALNKENHRNYKVVVLPHSAMGIYKYIEEVENMSLPKQVIATMVKVYQNFLVLYKNTEKEIKALQYEAISIKYQKDLEKFYLHKVHPHWNDWRKVVQVAQSAIIKFSNHVEDYNNYFGADTTTFGELKRTKVKSCLDRKEECKECEEEEARLIALREARSIALRKAQKEGMYSTSSEYYDPLDWADLSDSEDSTPSSPVSKNQKHTKVTVSFTLENLLHSIEENDYSPDLKCPKINECPCKNGKPCTIDVAKEKEVLKKQLRKKNMKYRSFARTYLKLYGTQVNQSKRVSESVQEIEVEQKDISGNIEVEIDNFSQQEGSLEKLKNLMSKGVHEKWMTSISKIELAVCEMAEHVEMWELDSVNRHISWDLRFVMIPKNEPCEKRYPCKNCLDVNPVQTESRYAPFVSADSDDLEGRKLWLLSVLNSSRASVGMGPIDLQKTRAIAPPDLPTQATLENNLLFQETQKTVVDQFSSGSTIEKPYVLTRSKVDFTMEDLENAAEEEDDFSPHLSVPDISERQQPKRICKRDLFLNQ